MRSGRFITAATTLPMMNPACTATASHAAPPALSPQSWRSAGTIAVALNHVELARTAASATRPSARRAVGSPRARASGWRRSPCSAAQRRQDLVGADAPAVVARHGGEADRAVLPDHEGRRGGQRVRAVAVEVGEVDAEPRSAAVVVSLCANTSP